MTELRLTYHWYFYFIGYLNISHESVFLQVYTFIFEIVACYFKHHIIIIIIIIIITISGVHEGKHDLVSPERSVASRRGRYRSFTVDISSM